MGITGSLGAELESIFNHWANVRITDKEVKQLVKLAMCPNKEVLKNLKKGANDNLSTTYKNMVESVFEYSQSSPTQQMHTTAWTIFGAYNAITGYFQNIRKYKDEEAKFKSIMDGTGKQRAQVAFTFAKTLRFTALMP